MELWEAWPPYCKFLYTPCHFAACNMYSLHGASGSHHSTTAPKLGKGWLREGPWQCKEELILASLHLLMAVSNQEK